MWTVEVSSIATARALDQDALAEVESSADVRLLGMRGGKAIVGNGPICLSWEVCTARQRRAGGSFQHAGTLRGGTVRVQIMRMMPRSAESFVADLGKAVDCGSHESAQVVPKTDGAGEVHTIDKAPVRAAGCGGVGCSAYGPGP